MSSTNKKKKQYFKSQLTPAKKKFAEVVALTDNASEAVRQAFPELKNSSQSYISTKATRLMRNDAIKSEISNRKEKIEELADRAVEVFARNMTSDNETISQRAAEYVYDQVEGKSVQQINTQSSHIVIGIDLSHDSNSQDA